jgi:hypothetical protein
LEFSVASKPIVEVGLEFDTKDTTKKAESNLRRAGQRGGDAFSSGFRGAISGIAATVGALLVFRSVSRFIGESVKLSSIQQNAVNELNTALKSTGQFTNQASADLQDFASSLQAVTTIGDEATLSTAALIQSLGRLPVDQLKEATLASANLSAALGIDLRSAATLVGKAAAGEVSTFSRYGLSIQKAATVSETFRNALDALNARFSGAVEARVKTFAGAVQQLSNNYGDFKETIGSIITNSPALISVINTTSNLILGINNNLASISDGDPLKPLLIGFISIARVINDDLIPPFRFFFGLVQTGFNVLKTGVQGVLTAIAVSVEATFGVILEAVSSLPGEIGRAAGAASDILKNLSDTTQSVLADMGESTFENLITAEQTEDFKLKVDEILNKYQQAIDKSREFKDQTKSAFIETATEVNKNAEAIGKSLNSALGSGIANGIESITKSLAKGENVFKAFGQAALGLVADFAVQAGKLFVATGIAQLALFGSPAASIAAGAALIAAGTLAKQFFGGESGGNANAPAGVNLGGGSPSTEPQFSNTQQEERRADQSVQLIVQGDILDSEDTGRRLIRLLNDNFESEASALTAVRFA